jgi:amino acid permease
MPIMMFAFTCQVPTLPLRDKTMMPVLLYNDARSFLWTPGSAWQVNVFAIYQELEKPSPKRMGEVARKAVGVCVAVYASMGIFGFSDFGPATVGNVLTNYCISADYSPG